MTTLDKTTLERVIQDVISERERQYLKWGEQNHSPFVWIVILVEEVGELSQAALHYRFGESATTKIRKEMIHIAAVAVQIVECFDRGKWNWSND